MTGSLAERGAPAPEPHAKPSCPSCSVPMVLRQARTGPLGQWLALLAVQEGRAVGVAGLVAELHMLYAY